ncbi:unnamed protein product [Cuscuta europaea]|uniref:Uncharacterized protein n=1 Tax=Cuscuta europaea TaxID=41803 RepID=A0A9P0ZLY0_CUSEU|nr:unnamed protein product [Cuscuta europaea]
MCRGFHPNRQDCIKMQAFYIHVSVFPTARNSLPEFLTLNYLPRIDDSPLEINGSRIRSDAPGFVALHRLVSAAAAVTGAVYGSRERVEASEGARFELYVGDSRLMKGIFRKDWEGDFWKLEWECLMPEEEENSRCLGIKAAEVCISVEGAAAEWITGKVDVIHPRRRHRRRCHLGLEEIPERRETETEVEASSGCCCCRGEGVVIDGEDGGECDAAVEGVGWAVDVGIWMVCLGVGYLVSRASRKSLMRKLMPS